jgi:hypothetical protein
MKSTAPASTLGLSQRKRPRAVEDLCSRAEETYRVIPPRRDRQAVLDLAVAPAELDGDRTIRTLFRGDAIHRKDIVLVRLEVTLAVVDGE